MKVTLPQQNKVVTRHIPYVNIAAQHAPLREKLLKAIGRVIDHGQFVLGPEVQEFEKRFAELCGVRFAVALNSGTDALILALRVLGIGPDDEVITAPNSFVSSTSAIAIVGARPVFVDVREDYNLDPDKIEKAVTPKTKAILPVHLTGRPADMDAILAIAKRHRLAVIEDAAQAVLAEYRGKRVGSLGDLGCFSIHPLKTLNACGDGGVVTTSDEFFARELKLLRNLGLETRDNCTEWSSNSRLDTMQAACLLVKLDEIDGWTEKRRKNAAFYQKALADIPGLTVPHDEPHEKAVYHTFVIQADRRDELKDFLQQHGVGTAIHYPIPIHLQTAAKKLNCTAGSFPVSERLAKRILSLPVHQNLSPDDLEYIADRIRDFYGRN